MAYSSTVDEYVQLKNLFCASASEEAKTYFLCNWDNIRDQWVMGDKFSTGNFLNNTNNRLECLNGKLKQVITKYSSLENLFKQFFIILLTLRNESDHKAIMSFQKSTFTYHQLPAIRSLFDELCKQICFKAVQSSICISIHLWGVFKRDIKVADIKWCSDNYII